MSRFRLTLFGMAALIAAAPAMAAEGRAARVPEPASVSLLVLGAVGLVIGRRLSRRR
ncbi:PEP-CTERM sorting domain-containing protein [Sphingomonas solaris]|uniref:PEP-CTERM sorting domain-containing protein n=1 Tax=Alterirhizorhabdus solaris TaxID=2529389 RepID=A0A558QZ73_9SPHN|nr:PEP-CTERM sorting domain-containing protein [Sphingomonas solaris]TVV72430.1 PEP-CTERM sorting domain-containing protein [Sphingomonas solaris]